jgi:hypothetical protein
MSRSSASVNRLTTASMVVWGEHASSLKRSPHGVDSALRLTSGACCPHEPSPRCGERCGRLAFSPLVARSRWMRLVATHTHLQGCASTGVRGRQPAARLEHHSLHHALQLLHCERVYALGCAEELEHERDADVGRGEVREQQLAPALLSNNGGVRDKRQWNYTR